MFKKPPLLLGVAIYFSNLAVFYHLQMSKKTADLQNSQNFLSDLCPLELGVAICKGKKKEKSF